MTIVSASATGPAPKPRPPTLLGLPIQSANEAPSGRVGTYANQKEKIAFQPKRQYPTAGTAITDVLMGSEGKCPMPRVLLRHRPQLPRRPPGATSTRLGVVTRPVPVDDYHGLLAHHPRVVPAGQRGDIAGPGDHLGAVVHANCELPAHVILEVRRLATVGPRDRFDIV